jgi:thiol-disulfide isomerase/thioredoxin
MWSARQAPACARAKDRSKLEAAGWPARLFAFLVFLLPFASATPAGAQTQLPELTFHLTPVKPRAQAKDFAFKDLDGKLQRLSDYRGKVVLVNFWATWCPPCRREMPSMERLHQKLKDQPFAILAVNQMENFDLVFSFTGQLEPAPTFPILLDGEGKSAKAWGVKGLPASFIVDKQGRIAYRAMGGREFDHPEMEKVLRALIQE